MMTTVGRHHKFYDAIPNCTKWREIFYDDHLGFYDANTAAQWRLLQCDESASTSRRCYRIFAVALRRYRTATVSKKYSCRSYYQILRFIMTFQCAHITSSKPWHDKAQSNRPRHCRCCTIEDSGVLQCAKNISKRMAASALWERCILQSTALYARRRLQRAPCGGRGE